MVYMEMIATHRLLDSLLIECLILGTFTLLFIDSLICINTLTM